MLSGDFAVLQAPIFDGLSLDPFALFDDGWGSAEVGVGGRHVVQALVIAEEPLDFWTPSILILRTGGDDGEAQFQ
jgi:hypothetical protein